MENDPVCLRGHQKQGSSQMYKCHGKKDVSESLVLWGNVCHFIQSPRSSIFKG